MHKNPWTIISSSPIYDNNWINVVEHKIINPAGGDGVYGKVHFKNLAVGVVALDEEGSIYLVGQYRFPLDAYSWEIPEGGSPYGVDPLESAKRELKEETGIIAHEWQKLLDIHLSNSVSDEKGYIYLATGLEFSDAEPEETEVLQVRKIALEEAYQMVLNGSITDSLSVAGILRTKILLAEKTT